MKSQQNYADALVMIAILIWIGVVASHAAWTQLPLLQPNHRPNWWIAIVGTKFELCSMLVFTVVAYYANKLKPNVWRFLLPFAGWIAYFGLWFLMPSNG